MIQRLAIDDLRISERHVKYWLEHNITSYEDILRFIQELNIKDMDLPEGVL